MKSATFAEPRKPAAVTAAKSPKAKPLMEQIHDHIAKRRDCRIIAVGDGTIGSRIVGVQLKRTWRKHIYNPDSFSPHEREYWEYYGQAFIIEEASLNKHFELDPAQLLLQADMEEVATIVVLATKFDEMIEALGREPNNVEEYLERLAK